MNIGIVVACKNEIDALLNSSIKYEKLADFPYEIYFFKYKRKNIYVALSGVGSIAASGATQYLISIYLVDLILNYGTCGALVDSLVGKQVVLIDGLIDYEFDTSAVDNCPKYTHVELGYASPLMKINNWSYEIVKNKLKECKCVNCLSSNKFISDPILKDKLANEFNTQICEFESAGIFLTCLKNKIDCIFIKSISDSKSENASSYIKNASISAIDAFNTILKII